MGRREGGSPLFDKVMPACHSDNAVVVSSYYWAAFRPA
jgi:predicted NAD/FAD-binding protein